MITDVVILSENGEHDAWRVLNAYLMEHTQGTTFAESTLQWARMSAGDVRVASVIDLDRPALLAQIEQAPWRVGGAVVLLLRDQEQELTLGLPMMRSYVFMNLWGEEPLVTVPKRDPAVRKARKL